MRIVHPATLLAAWLLTGLAHADAKYQFQMTVATDWQTVQSYGGPTAAQAALRARVDTASAIYEEQMGLKLVVAKWIMPTSEAQDFPNPDTQPWQLLDALVVYREASQAQCATGVTVLMTTRVFTDNVLGLSNDNSACWGQAASVVQVNFGAGDDAIILAHEIGHVLGADHDGDPAGSCPSTPQGEYIMTPESYRNSTNTFSPCSVQRIVSLFAQHPCIAPIAPPAIQPAAQPTPSGGHGGGAFDWLSVLVLLVAAARRLVNR